MAGEGADNVGAGAQGDGGVGTSTLALLATAAAAAAAAAAGTRAGTATATSSSKASSALGIESSKVMSSGLNGGVRALPRVRLLASEGVVVAADGAGIGGGGELTIARKAEKGICGQLCTTDRRRAAVAGSLIVRTCSASLTREARPRALSEDADDDDDDDDERRRDRDRRWPLALAALGKAAASRAASMLTSASVARL